MDKVIPIMPCPNIKAQVEFYQQLGFELIDLYTSPNPYAAVQFGMIELHFYGSRKVVPSGNPTMCFIQVDDVDAVYDAFSSSIKRQTGKVPRSGIPRITKVRDLSNDRRFTLTDTGGNTIFVGSRTKPGTGNFFRTIQNEEFAQKFAVLYDLVYSKEDCRIAANMLQKSDTTKDLLNDLDKAKFLLVAIEIQQQLKQPIDDIEIKSLFEGHKNDGDDWEEVKKRYYTILQEE